MMRVRVRCSEFVMQMLSAGTDDTGKSVHSAGIYIPHSGIKVKIIDLVRWVENAAF